MPIIYFVERLREGRSYSTRSVKAVQNGKIIFQLLCSFHAPEPWQPSHQWPVPAGVPSLEECELEEDLFRRRAARDGLDRRLKEIYLTYATVRISRPLDALRTTRISAGACQRPHCCQKSRPYGYRRARGVDVHVLDASKDWRNGCLQDAVPESRNIPALSGFLFD